MNGKMERIFFFGSRQNVDDRCALSAFVLFCKAAHHSVMDANRICGKCFFLWFRTMVPGEGKEKKIWKLQITEKKSGDICVSKSKNIAEGRNEEMEIGG